MRDSNRYVSVPFTDKDGKGFIYFHCKARSKDNETLKIRALLFELIKGNPYLRFGKVRINQKPSEGIKYDDITYRTHVKGNIHFHYSTPEKEVSLV